MTLAHALMFVIKIIEFVKMTDCYVNILIAYKILLIMYVTITLVKRNFFKIKINKNLLEVINILRKIK